MLKSIEINLTAIKENAKAIQKLVGAQVKVLAVVKSDAYGHGAARIVESLNLIADFFGVDNLEEAIKIRSVVRKPVLIFGAIEDKGLEILANSQIRIPIYDRNSLDLARKARQPFRVHLKVDTGMHRLGFEPAEAVAVAKEIVRAKNLELEGLWSHFAISGEKKGRDYSLAQIKRFDRVRADFKEVGIKPSFYHLSNSSGIFYYPQARYNLIRSGILLYGYYPNSEIKARFKNRLRLEPALAFKTKIIQIRRLKKGERIGYGLTYRLEKDGLIGVLPVGYKDGYGRSLSNRGAVLVRGNRCPIVGRICMRMMMIDLSKIRDPRVGEEAVLIGRQGDDKIGAEELADQIGTIPYEVLSRLDPEIKRIYK